MPTASFDLKFRLYDALAGPSPVGPENVRDDVVVTDGLFTVELDFLAGAFPGTDRWLEIDVKADAAGLYDTLIPRQQIRPTPYAMYAFSADSVPDGGLPTTYGAQVEFTNPGNTLAGNGSGITKLNASELTSGVLDSGRLSGAYSNALILSNPGNSLAGDGLGLFNLDWGGLVNVPAGFADFIDDDTQYGAGQGLQLSGTTFLLDPQGAASGEVLKWNGGGWAPGPDDIGPSYWSPNGSDVYNNSGNVGIGTSTPTSRLTVEMSGTVDPLSVVTNGTEVLEVNYAGGITLGPRNDIAALGVGANTASGDHVDLSFLDASSINVRIRLYSDKVIFVETGEVGIGTETPTAPLHVLGYEDNGEVVRIENPNSTNAFGLYVQQGAGSVSSLGQSAAIVGESEHGTGIAGYTDSVAAGVYGQHAAYTGPGIGVDADSFSDVGIALYALAEHLTGVNYAVRAHTNSANGYAGYFTGGTQLLWRQCRNRRNDANRQAPHRRRAPTRRFWQRRQPAVTARPRSTAEHPALTEDGAAIEGRNDDTPYYGFGVSGYGGFIGLWGEATVAGSAEVHGVHGRAGNGDFNIGVLGEASGSTGVRYGVYSNGDMHVQGTLSKTGGSFRIDHPLDPENKELWHSFVESPDMMNIYNGNVVTDSDGYAIVTMPDWFPMLSIVTSAISSRSSRMTTATPSSSLR